jgi:hypothetical protein
LSETKKILWKGRVPDELRVALSDSDIIFTQNESELNQCTFRYGVEASSNISMAPINWNNIKSGPCIYFNQEILGWEIPQLIFKRVLAGEGALGPEESYKGILLKAGSFKVLNAGSLGYYSDLLAKFPGSLRVNPVNVRAFAISLFSFLDYCSQANLAYFPIEVDYGISQNCFFIQIHCDSSELYLENILDAANEHDPQNPVKNLIREASSKVDLMEVYGLKSSNKLVFTGCWIGNPNFMRSQSFPSLAIYQLDSYRTNKERKGRIPDIQSINNHSVDEFQRVKLAESLPKKYKKQHNISLEMVVNPILVKRIVEFVRKHRPEQDFLDFSLNDLRALYPRFWDQSAISRINESEEEEVLALLRNVNIDLDQKVEHVKDQIPSEDYLSRLVSSLEEMSFDEALVAANLEDESLEVHQKISGEKEDLLEESQKVSGQKEILKEERKKISGEAEDLTEEIQRVGGQRESLTEEVEKIAGSLEDLTEEVSRVLGEKEDLTEEVQVISGEKEQREKLQIIKGEKEKNGVKNWEVKRTQTVQRIKEKAEELRVKGLTNKEIDENIKMIVSEELGLSQKKSEAFTKTLSDDVSDDIVNEGIDVLNENIKQRFRLEKVENQLTIREKQVTKMKQLIEGLKRELSQSKSRLNELEGKSSALSNVNSENFNQEPINNEVAAANSQVSTMVSVEPPSPTSDVASENEIKLPDPSLDLLNEESGESASGKQKNFKAKNIELEREVTKLKNERIKLESENQILLRKLKEVQEVDVEAKGDEEDSSALKKKNEALESQVESLKNRLTFMYENSKSRKDIAIGANEVQKVIEDKERFFKEKMQTQEELERVKADVRERDRIIKQKDLELQQKSDLLKNKPIGEDHDALKALENEKTALALQLKTQSDELKAESLKTKSFEQKVKFLNAQLQKFQNTPKARELAGNSAIDPKIASKLKQAEMMSLKFKYAGEKLQKELAEKKTELHKTKLENKSMQLKIKNLEKKLLNIAKKKAA